MITIGVSVKNVKMYMDHNVSNVRKDKILSSIVLNVKEILLSIMANASVAQNKQVA